MKKYSQCYSFLFILLLGLLTVTLETGCGDATDGCTNPNADNYDAEAEEDDGSCIISGCIDVDAENYNSQANNDDGSCIYARDKFIGDYEGQFACNVLPLTNDMVTFLIAEGLEANTVFIQITNGVAAGISLGGSVDGDEITVNTQLPPLPLLDIDMDGNPDPLVLSVTGTVTTSDGGNTVEGPLNIVISLQTGMQVAQDVCNIVGTKQ